MEWMKMFGHFVFTTLQFFCVPTLIAVGAQRPPIVLSHEPLCVPTNKMVNFSETPPPHTAQI